MNYLKYSKNHLIEIRCSIAENHNTPLEILLTLLNDNSNYVKVAVLRNPNLPADVFRSQISAQMWNGDAQYIFAKNLNTPPEILDVLIGTLRNNQDIIKAALCNPNTSSKTILNIMNGTSEYAWFAKQIFELRFGILI